MKPVCKRCLLAEAGMNGVYESVKGYIAAIPQEQKVSDKAYAARLDICRNCGSLTNGTCVKCGCFVEVRAVKKRLGCPDENDKWAEIKTD
ncbi:MAG: DUF6171 family protein [Oscillospiraceae bacterium]